MLKTLIFAMVISLMSSMLYAETKIPEYYGYYAIDSGKFIELKEMTIFEGSSRSKIKAEALNEIRSRKPIKDRKPLKIVIYGGSVPDSPVLMELQQTNHLMGGTGTFKPKIMPTKTDTGKMITLIFDDLPLEMTEFILYDRNYAGLKGRLLSVVPIYKQESIGPIKSEGEDTVCEIGCAAGHFLAAIADQIKSGVGIDTADAAIAAALSLKQKRSLQNIDFLVVSAEDYAASSGVAAQFSYVFLMDVTEHVDDTALRGILNSAKRLLSAHGQLIIHTPNQEYWLEQLKDRGVLSQFPGHIAVRSLRQYQDLLIQSGFAIASYKSLPHYRQPLRFTDALLMKVPNIGKRFVSRLFISARRSELAK